MLTSAGVILAGTFGVLMTQPIRELFQFGFAMGIGILLDTLLVRAVMVPAIAQLLGDRSWWPGRVENRPAAISSVQPRNEEPSDKLPSQQQQDPRDHDHQDQRRDQHDRVSSRHSPVACRVKIR